MTIKNTAFVCTRAAVRDGGMCRAQFQGHGATESGDEAFSEIGANQKILLGDLHHKQITNRFSFVLGCESDGYRRFPCADRRVAIKIRTPSSWVARPQLPTVLQSLV